jgi:hypothetical protein
VLGLRWWEQRLAQLMAGHHRDLPDWPPVDEVHGDPDEWETGVNTLPLPRRHPSLHGTRASLADLVRGDIVAIRAHDTQPAMIAGVVDTVGRRFVNVVTVDGTHHAYPPEEIDLID